VIGRSGRGGGEAGDGGWALETSRETEGARVRRKGGAIVSWFDLIFAGGC
jgi:hypothetical protein